MIDPFSFVASVQGIMLSKALKVQQVNEDAEYEAGISDLQGEVDKLRESLEEKDKEITSLEEVVTEAKKKNEEVEDACKKDMVKIKEQGDTIGELCANLE